MCDVRNYTRFRLQDAAEELDFELMHRGGFALILKYQLYPWTHRELAKRVNQELDLPVDAPRFLAEGTMKRFLKWHGKKL